MAFQRPIPRPSRRAPIPPPLVTTKPQSQREQPVEQSPEWILFSSIPVSTAHARTNSLQTPHTFAPSKLSDVGSLNTGFESGKQDDVESQAVQDDEGAEEELDSLDDGLHAFNEPAGRANARALVDESTNTVLPAHDGLGTFAGNSSPVQEHFWSHERYNPRRRKQSLRRSGLQSRFDALDDEEKCMSKHDRFERIEKWRLDQSRAIAEEIEQQSKGRRRRSRLSVNSTAPAPEEFPLDDVTPVPEPDARETVEEVPAPQSESLLGRVTRCVIRDILGIDDTVLTYLFGEALPPDIEEVVEEVAKDVNTRAETQQPKLQLVRTNGSWEERIMARVARELGILVHQISEHPGAFNTYLRTQDSLPYAGIASTAENTLALSTTHTADIKQSFESPLSPHFSPTLKQRRRRKSAAVTDPSLWGIEGGSPSDEPLPLPEHEPDQERLRREKQYWEQDLDVKMVFGFLKDRLSPPRPLRSATQPTSQSQRTSVANGESSAGRDSLRRAALIRHHHPLVSRNISSTASSLPQPSPVLGRRQKHFDDEVASSCASQSTKRSKTHHSGSFSLGSSRNYWDIGGSLGGGSALGGGAWGEA